MSVKKKKSHGSCPRCKKPMRGTQAGTIRCSGGCRPEEKA